MISLVFALILLLITTCNVIVAVISLLCVVINTSSVIAIMVLNGY